jgi:hypothetical protein
MSKNRRDSPEDLYSDDWLDLPVIKQADQQDLYSDDWLDLPVIKQSGGASGTWSTPGASGSWSEPADWRDLPELSFTDLAKKRIDERVIDLNNAGKTDLQLEETSNTDSLVDSLAKSARNFGDKLTVGKAVIKGLADAVQDKYGHGSSASRGNEVMEMDKLKADIGEDNNVITEEIGRLAGYVSPAAYESITDRKHYSDNEIAVLEKENPALAQEIKSRQRDLVANAVTGLGNLAVGLVRAPIAGVIGLYDAVQEGGLSGGAEAVGRTAADLAAMTAGSLTDTLTSPGTKLMNDPVGFLGDAASVVGAGAALKAGAAGAVQAAKAGQKLDALAEVAKAGAVAAGELSPFPVGLMKVSKAGAAADAARASMKTTDLIDRAVLDIASKAKSTGTDIGGNLASVTQALYDARAGVSGADLMDIEKFKLSSDSRKVAIANQVEDALSKLNSIDQSAMRNILAGERTRAVMADWPAQLGQLRTRVNTAIKEGVLTADEAVNLLKSEIGSAALDIKLQRRFKDSAKMTAVNLHKALSQKDIIMTAKVGDKVEDISSPSYLIFNKPFNWNTIEIKANPLAPEPIRKLVGENIDALTSIRRISVELGQEATNVMVGPNKSLLGLDVFNSRIAYYTPDLYVGSNAESLRAALKPIADDSLGSFQASKLKNIVGFEQRKAAGATDDLITAYTLASRKAVEDIEKFKLFERLSERASLVHKPGLVKVPEGVITGSHIQRFGALAGKYIDANLLEFLTKVDSTMLQARDYQRVLIKARSLFGTSKVVMNPVSWFNNLVGNWLHNAVDAGITGAANYPLAIGREIGRGMKLLGDDEFSKAAKSVGLIADNDMLNKRELMDIAESVSKRGIKDGSILSINRTLETIEAKEDWLLNKATKSSFGKKMHDMFSSLDNGSRMAIFERGVKQEAKARGIPVSAALRNTELLAVVAQKVKQYHADYSDVPTLLANMDKYGVLPFARYGWKSIGMLADMPVLNPSLARAATAGDKLVQDNLTDYQREQLRLAPDYMHDRVLPLDNGKVLNLKNMTPYGVPSDLISAGDRGGAKAEFQKASDAVTFAPGGMYADLLWLLAGKDPLTGRDTKTDAEFLEQGSRSRALLDLVAPGIVYHASKVISAAEGVPDRRGRVQSVDDAVLHGLGIKQEELDVNQAKERLHQGYKKRMKELELRRKDDLMQINPAWPQEKQDKLRARIDEKYRKLLEEAGRRFNSLVRSPS